LAQIASAANVTAASASAAVARLVESGDIVEIQKPVEYVAKLAFDEVFARAKTAIEGLHSRAPWRLGCTAAEIAAALALPEPLTARLLSAWHDDGRIGHRARCWHLPDFSPSLTPEQRTFFERALAGDPHATLLPKSHEAVVGQAGTARIEGLLESLESLIATGALVKIGDDVYRRSQIARANTVVMEILQNNPMGATMAQFRDALGTSRRYALPLMEYFDTIGLTIRDGDLRRLRGTAGKSSSPVQV
jgi:selenocysteine-specific elongation factor